MSRIGVVRTQEPPRRSRVRTKAHTRRKRLLLLLYLVESSQVHRLLLHRGASLRLSLS